MGSAALLRFAAGPLTATSVDGFRGVGLLVTGRRPDLLALDLVHLLTLPLEKYCERSKCEDRADEDSRDRS